MAGASRLLRPTATRFQSVHPSSSSSSSSTSNSPFMTHCRLNGRKSVAVSWDIAIASPEQKHKTCLKKGMESVELISSLAAKLAKLIFGYIDQWRQENTSKCWGIGSEIFVENGIIGCQSFTLIAIAGSLIGSVLCFVEGCFFVSESFLPQFQVISQRFDQGGIIRPAIEAIDMFLVGTTMLTLGMGLYMMFIGSQNVREKRWNKANSNFRAFSLKKLAESMEMQSITQAKSKVGHVILLIMQAGMLDNFKAVPLACGFDLTCFGAAVFISSVSVFLLSKLTLKQQ